MVLFSRWCCVLRLTSLVWMWVFAPEVKLGIENKEEEHSSQKVKVRPSPGRCRKGNVFYLVVSVLGSWSSVQRTLADITYSTKRRRRFTQGEQELSAWLAGIYSPNVNNNNNRTTKRPENTENTLNTHNVSLDINPASPSILSLPCSIDFQFFKTNFMKYEVIPDCLLPTSQDQTVTEMKGSVCEFILFVL